MDHVRAVGELVWVVADNGELRHVWPTGSWSSSAPGCPPCSATRMPCASRATAQCPTGDASRRSAAAARRGGLRAVHIVHAERGADALQQPRGRSAFQTCTASHPNPENTIFHAKRLIDRNHADNDAQLGAKHWPFKDKSSRGKPTWRLSTRERTPTGESASVRSLRTRSPPSERTSTTLCVRLRKMPERLPVFRSSVSSTCPAAAAIGCGLDKHGDEQRIIAYKRDVETFDVSLLSIDGDVLWPC